MNFRDAFDMSMGHKLDEYKFLIFFQIDGQETEENIYEKLSVLVYPIMTGYPGPEVCVQGIDNFFCVSR